MSRFGETIATNQTYVVQYPRWQALHAEVNE